VDGVVDIEAAKGYPPDMPASNQLWNATDCVSFDRRLYDFAPDIYQARSLAVSAFGDEVLDPGLLGWWKGDDGTGAVVTDYTATANNGSIGGVENTDYEWLASEKGEPEIDGNPYPILHGYVQNALATRIDNTRDLFQVGVEDDVQVRDAGDVVSPTELGGGVIDFADPGPQEPVTVEWPSTGAADDSGYYVAQLAADLLTGRGGEDSTTLDLDAAEIPLVYDLCVLSILNQKVATSRPVVVRADVNRTLSTLLEKALLKSLLTN